MKKVLTAVITLTLAIIFIFNVNITADAYVYSNINDVSISSYDAFRNSVYGKAFNVDGAAGAQCWDGACILWKKLGRNLQTGNDNARGCWTRCKDVNAGEDFILIDNLADVKRGDVVVFGYGDYGHIAFADVDYHGGNTLSILGQNQRTKYEVWGYDSEGHAITEGPFSLYDQPVSSFLGAFRYKGWSSTVAIESGDYLIQSAVGNKYLNVENGVNQNGANIQITTSNGSESQIFHIGWNDYFKANSIEMKNTGKFVDTEGNTNGVANIFLWEGTGAEGQNWYFEDAGDGYYYIRNVWGYYLDVVNGENRDGTNVTTYSYNGGENQKWRLVKVSGMKANNIPEGSYTIQSKIGGKNLDVNNAVATNGSNISIFTSNGSEAQKFYVGYSKAYSSAYIEFGRTGKFVDSDGNKREVTNIQLWEGTGVEGQNWYFEDAGDGYYYIRNVWGYYLDVVNGEDRDGTNVTTYYFNGGDNQKWKLNPVDRCEVKGYTVSLDGKIGINYYLDVSDDIADTAIVTLSNTSEQVHFEEVKTIYGANYCIRAYVAPKDVDEIITLTIKDNDGNVYVNASLSLGEYINASYTANNNTLNNLLTRLKDYCYMAKQYFAGVDYTAEGGDYDLVADYVSEYAMAYEDSGCVGAKYIGSSLVLENEVSICHYFVFDNGYSIEDFEIDCNGDEIITVDGNVCCIKIPNITALDMEINYITVVSDMDGNSVEIEYSVLSYIDTAVHNEIDSKLDDLVKSLFWYYIYCEFYAMSA